MADLPTDPAPGDALPVDPADEDVHDEVQSFADRLRGSGVGTEDPNIVGDAGPLDIPPGTEGPEDWPDATGVDHIET